MFMINIIILMNFQLSHSISDSYFSPLHVLFPSFGIFVSYLSLSKLSVPIL